MTNVRIPIVENVLSANDRLAQENRSHLDAAGVLGLNVMASPGAGKTSLIVGTIEKLAGAMRIGVVEGDVAAVTIDAERVAAKGIPAVQINTGGACHLDAGMLGNALSQLVLDELDLIIVENVGNLVCPAAFALGTHVSVLVASLPEGDDKPYKYPRIYHGLDAVILNKIDLRPHLRFNEDYFRRGVEMLNPGLMFLPLSCETGEGLDRWTEWLRKKVARAQRGSERRTSIGRERR